MTIYGRFGSGLATLAAVSLAAPAVQAADIVRLPIVQAQPTVAHPAKPWQAETAQDRRHRGYRGGYGWRRYDNRVRGEDLLIAGAILGTIAVIASSAEKKDRERREDARWRYRDRPRDVPPPGSRHTPQAEREARAGDTDLVEDVVDACVHGAQRDGSVDRVDTVARVSGGWRVEGRMADGRDFTCETDGEGRVTNTDVNGRSRGYTQAEDPRPEPARAEEAEDWSDEARDETPRGGGGRGSPDDRYQTSKSPDFEDGEPI